MCIHLKAYFRGAPLDIQGEAWFGSGEVFSLHISLVKLIFWHFYVFFTIDLGVSSFFFFSSVGQSIFLFSKNFYALLPGYQLVRPLWWCSKQAFSSQKPVNWRQKQNLACRNIRTAKINELSLNLPKKTMVNTVP